jgi:hypothetical protein
MTTGCEYFDEMYKMKINANNEGQHPAINCGLVAS